jgi:hypothetical protein
MQVGRKDGCWFWHMTRWSCLPLGALRVPFRPKKVEISGPTPSNALRNEFPPHPNTYVQPQINNRYIGNFMDKRQETKERQEISGSIQRWFIIRG